MSDLFAEAGASQLPSGFSILRNFNPGGPIPHPLDYPFVLNAPGFRWRTAWGYGYAERETQTALVDYATHSQELVSAGEHVLAISILPHDIPAGYTAMVPDLQVMGTHLSLAYLFMRGGIYEEHETLFDPPDQDGVVSRVSRVVPTNVSTVVLQVPRVDLAAYELLGYHHALVQGEPEGNMAIVVGHRDEILSNLTLVGEYDYYSRFFTIWQDLQAGLASIMDSAKGGILRLDELDQIDAYKRAFLSQLTKIDARPQATLVFDPNHMARRLALFSIAVSRLLPGYEGEMLLTTVDDQGVERKYDLKNVPGALDTIEGIPLRVDCRVYNVAGGYDISSYQYPVKVNANGEICPD